VALADEVRAALAEAREPVEVDLALGAQVVRGWLSPMTTRGLVACRPSPVGPRDRIALWVRHLALNAAAPPGAPRESRHYGEGEALRLGPVADAGARLARLVELYRQGLSEPLPFYPASSHAYADALARGKGREAALRAAQGAWEGSPGRPGEGADPEVALAQRGRDPLGATFEALAGELLLPMIACAAAGGGDADAGA
jgi:exodeoxyribonuclease V gamma subunit